MRQLRDPVWQVRGTSWLWDEEARNQICTASEVMSLRQFLRAKGNWPDELPSNGGRTLVVAGLDGSLDLLTPGDAESWLADAIKPAVLSFQDENGDLSGMRELYNFGNPNASSKARRKQPVSGFRENNWVGKKKIWRN